MPRSAPTASLILACCAAAHATPGFAAEPVKVEAAKKEAVAKVEVKAKAEDYDPRRDDTASKTVMTQEEILKYGDTSVYDVLKRAPGVTVVGNSIRMRGLGNGYTQILVNGERPPPGFSLDAVPPDQIERIEIIRAASAEFSMQAIAGTINIVLKKVVTKPQKDLRLSVNHAQEKQSQFVNGTLADKRGKLSWVVTAMVQHNASAATNTETDRSTAPGGTATLLRNEADAWRNYGTTASLGPRMSWQLADGGQLNLSANIQAQRGGGNVAGREINLVGGYPAPDYLRQDDHTIFHGVSDWVELNWVAKLWGGKLDAKLNGANGHFSGTIDRLSATSDGAVQLRRVHEQRQTYPRVGSSGKYTRSLFDGHAMAVGWEVNRGRQETVDHRVEGVVGQVPQDFVEGFDPIVRQMSAFVQDEWNVSKQWSMYLGARWEDIRTDSRNMDSRGGGAADSTSNNHVLSPVAQTLYKFPDKSGRQLRLALTHTFKAPTPAQLSARRSEADQNTRFSPDTGGNPDLKPEQANGIDLTYEHFWAPGAVYSIGTSQRRIRDYIRNLYEQDANGRWLYHPVNDGNALVRTFDIELKFPMKAVMKDGAPPLDLRLNLNRNWSEVDQVPGPGNRLDQQIPFTAMVGADYKKEPFSWGINLAYQTGGMVRVSEEMSTQLYARRGVDGYFQYSPRKGLDLRLSVGNALGVDSLGYSRYVDASGTNEVWTRSPQSIELRFNVGIKLR